MLHSEKDATLTLKSEAGRAVVTLCVELGHVHSAPEQGHLGPGPRNGQARQRRRVRRAAARQSVKEAILDPKDATIHDKVDPGNPSEEAEEVSKDSFGIDDKAA